MYTCFEIWCAAMKSWECWSSLILDLGLQPSAYQSKGVDVAKWLKATAWELWTRIVGSIYRQARNFYPGLQKNQQVTLSQGNNNLQWL